MSQGSQEPLPSYLCEYPGVATIGGPGYGDRPCEFYRPFAVDVTHDGYVAVVEWGNDRIQIFDARLRFVRVIGKTGKKALRFNRTFDVCCGRGDRKDEIAVVDQGNGRIQVVSVSGAFRHMFRTELCPWCICVDLHNNIYVGCTAGTIRVFSWTGTLLREFGSVTRGRISGICFDDEHSQIITAEFEDRSISVFSTSGELVRRFIVNFPGAITINAPNSVCFAGQGRLVVSDSDSHRLLVYDWDGEHERFVSTVGKYGRAPREFFYQRCGHVDARGRLLVADAENHRVQIIDPAPTRVVLLGCLLVAHLSSCKDLPDCL